MLLLVEHLGYARHWKQAAQEAGEICECPPPSRSIHFSNQQELGVKLKT